MRYRHLIPRRRYGLRTRDRILSMTLTRRQLLMAAVAAPTASAQSDHSNFVITSNSGLRLERHGDHQRPSIALYLPDAKHPSAIIEMPEHAWRKKKPAEEQLWFYRMYTSDPSLRGEVSWLKQGNALSYSMKTPSGFSLNSKATLEKDGVAISHQVTSVSELTWAMVEAPTCVKLYRPSPMFFWSVLMFIIRKVYN